MSLIFPVLFLYLLYEYLFLIFVFLEVLEVFFPGYELTIFQ